MKKQGKLPLKGFKGHRNTLLEQVHEAVTNTYVFKKGKSRSKGYSVAQKVN